MSKLFIPYIMGDLKFIENLKTLSEAGADIIEIGVPFSDPVADGSTIMNAGAKAIEAGVNINFIFEKLIQYKETISSKYVLMTYYNIISSYGENEFLKKCEEAGVYGLIIPDLPFELTQKFKKDYPNKNIKIISIIAMTTSKDRIERIAKKAEGFIYTVTMNATTGENGQFHPELQRKIQLIKGVTDVPVVAGFGIRNQEHVKDIGRIADGVVIGSEIVKNSLRINLMRRFNIYEVLEWPLIKFKSNVYKVGALILSQPLFIFYGSYFNFIFEYFTAKQGKLTL